MAALPPKNLPKKRRPSASESPMASTRPEGEQLLGKLLAILRDKAPEAIPILNDLINVLTPSPKDIVEQEKRSRSIVIAGLEEAASGTPAFQRQLHTEGVVHDILNALEVESRPVEIYRMGSPGDNSRLVKVVFSSQRPFFEVLKKARILRQIDRFRNVYIRRSMTREERSKFNELRSEARNRNQVEFNGERVYVVYRNTVVKACDIPKLKATAVFQKN